MSTAHTTTSPPAAPDAAPDRPGDGIPFDRRRLVAVLVVTPLIAALALWAFAWPASRIAPRDLPIGLVAPAGAPIAENLTGGPGEDAFDVQRYDDAAAAKAAIEDREIYGALVASPEGIQLLTASAASPAVAQLLNQAVAAQAPPGAEVTTTDVVALPEDDPRGTGFAAGALPLALAGVAAGAITFVMGLRGTVAAAALTGAAALVGLTAAAIEHSWLGILTGNWWAEAGVLGLTILAVGATVAGAAALLGARGIGLAALLIVLIGNPFSGVTSAPELLPGAAAWTGQLLPPGAGGSLLRSVAFFDGGGAAGPALVLTVWAVLGLTAMMLGGHLKRGRETARTA
ncbi:ABC transporter permease [Streptomyces sp. JJ38]|uniref:ABC transporter permease n=1 Tax=Streptomyces sp. JJ38 TaxID=2738128 RepID=UPI00214BF939|nr:ABC transporter permease [Streptomyces sp. JJ38]MBW1598088.1 ABC transporter permease [Streptomyces sp. JJ38]